jgi:hypothetical protein
VQRGWSCEIAISHAVDPERPVQDRLRFGLFLSTIARYGTREGFSSYLTTSHWPLSPFIGHDDPQNEVQQTTRSGKQDEQQP